MPITRTDVEKIAELSRLELAADETDLFTGQLGAIIGYVEKLNELDTSHVPAMSHCSPAGGESGEGNLSLRDDEARPSLGQSLAVENAPDSEGGYFKVPRVIGG
jgi:aspartyl-tRNA(Asn)/glutamyl-tRNA(Gln) amidotransferase subunit C